MKEADIKMVSLSLDGSTAAVHDDFRACPGAFDGVVRAAETFKRNGIKFLINSSFTKRNQHDIGDTFKVAKGLGATAWYMFMIVPTGRGEEIMNELISKEDYEEILAWHYQQESERGRYPHAPDLRAALLPDRAADGQGRRGRFRASLA